jgi:hypothetical protein
LAESASTLGVGAYCAYAEREIRFKEKTEHVNGPTEPASLLATIPTQRGPNLPLGPPLPFLCIFLVSLEIQSQDGLAIATPSQRPKNNVWDGVHRMLTFSFIQGPPEWPPAFLSCLSVSALTPK